MDEEAAEETRKLIEEATQKAEEAGETSNRNTVTWTDEGEGTSTATRTGVRIADGGSPIDSQSGKVMTEDGKEADNSADPGTPEAPTQSFITSEEDLPESVIKMRITPTSIEPAEFSVNPGQAVALSVTAAGDATEIFRFDDPSLKAVAVGVAPGKTRVITFNAPTEEGEYTYYSDVANHRARGAEGVMIVE
jgi:plastocyanin